MSKRIVSLTASGFPGRLVPAACPLCPAPREPDLIYRSNSGIGFWRCPDCSISYASPRFDEPSLRAIYENPAFFSRSFRQDWSYADWSRSARRPYLHARLKIDLVLQYLPEGARLLDVGCGHGLTLAEAEARGFECCGIDPSGMLTDFARKRFGVAAFRTTIDRFSAEGAFQGILLWDVLEHVPDPLTVVRECRRLLQSRGYLFIQVPNYRGFSNRAKTLLNRIGMRSEFSHFGFPWHLFAFDIDSTKALLKRADFAIHTFNSLTSLRKNDRSRALPRIVDRYISLRCLGDYLTVVATPSGCPIRPVF